MGFLEKFFKKGNTASTRPGYDVGKEVDTEYERIQAWLESRITNMKKMDPDELHQRLLQLLADERQKGAKWQEQLGYDPFLGLEMYITGNAYRQMLDKE